MRLKTAIILLLLAAIFAACRHGSSQKAVIGIPNLRQHLSVLAHDSLEGRGAGYAGEAKAARYIAAEFKKIGLQPLASSFSASNSYFQPFTYHSLGSNRAWEVLETQNVVGLLPGGELADEYIVIGGHHDGQGMSGQADFGRDLEGLQPEGDVPITDSIWNSAVDNAVSIAAILEIARQLSLEKSTLKRSILFVSFSAEETALNGSTHFVNSPPVPLSNIRAMLNLEKLVGDPDADFLYVSYGTHPVFERLRQQTDSLIGISLTPFYPGMIANSDHYAFGMRQIPTVTMGTGSEINVHTALDHGQTINYELLRSRTSYVCTYLKQLANMEFNPDYHGNNSGLLGVSGGPATEAELASRGLISGPAFKVSSVVEDSEGYKAGLQPGDMILAVDGQSWEEQNFYQGLEDLIGPTDNTRVTLTVSRGPSTFDVAIALD